MSSYSRQQIIYEVRIPLPTEIRFNIFTMKGFAYQTSNGQQRRWSGRLNPTLDNCMDYGDIPTLQRLTYQIAYYLFKHDRKLALPYVQIYIQLDLERRSTPGIVHDFIAALDEALSADESPSTIPADIESGFFTFADYRHDFIQNITTSSYMRPWQDEYALRIFSRADWIAAVLEYAALVGPYVSRSLLCVLNPRYQLIIAMRLVTPLAFRTTGRWPAAAPIGEEWSHDRWRIAPRLAWQPVSLEVIKAYVVLDRLLECGWFPDQRLNEPKQIREWVDTAYQNTRKVVKALASHRGPLAKHCDIASFHGTQKNPTSYRPALATAFKLDANWVLHMNQCDSWVQRNLQWRPVQLEASARETIRKLILIADARARAFSQSSDPGIQAIGERILGANVQLLVYAAVWYSERQGHLSRDAVKSVLAEWPFVIPNARHATFSSTQWKDKLICHLGNRNRSDGRKCAKIWCTAP